jgi:hypothetical protein
MDARLVALALAALLIGGLFLWFRRELERLDASPLARIVAVGAYVLCALGWIVVYALSAPFWLGWIASLPAAAMTLLPARYADLIDELESQARVQADATDAPNDLAGEIEAIGHSLTDRRAPLSVVGAELELRIERLDRWRSPEGDEPVDELVHLFQGWALDRLEGRPRDILLEADREERIAELLSRLEGTPPSARPATRPSWARLASRLRRLPVSLDRASGSGLRAPLDPDARGGGRSEGQTRGR